MSIIHCPVCKSDNVECRGEVQHKHTHLCHDCGYDGTKESGPQKGEVWQERDGTLILRGENVWYGFQPMPISGSLITHPISRLLDDMGHLVGVDFKSPEHGKHG